MTQNVGKSIFGGMKATLDRVTHDALELSNSERSALAHTLITSIDDQSDEDAERAWDAEIKTRVDDIVSGKVQGVPASEVFSKIKGKHS